MLVFAVTPCIGLGFIGVVTMSVLMMTMSVLMMSVSMAVVGGWMGFIFRDGFRLNIDRTDTDGSIGFVA